MGMSSDGIDTSSSSSTLDWCQVLFTLKAKTATTGTFPDCTALLLLLRHRGMLQGHLSSANARKIAAWQHLLFLLLPESYSLSVLPCSIVMLMVMLADMFVLVASWGVRSLHGLDGEAAKHGGGVTSFREVF